MAKLYPPQINGTIPAFYSNVAEGTTKVVVPFSMNRAVSTSQVKYMNMQMKTLNGSLICIVPSESIDFINMTATFNMRDYAYKITVGSYYKIQLAYIENNENAEIGYYSTVGVIKYTTYPSIVKIDGLTLSKINNHQYDYLGVYSQKDGDATEKLYSSRFNIYYNDKIFYESEEILHDNTNDTERYMQTENLQFLKSLPIDEVYTIEFIATSINGLVVRSPRYKIASRRSVDPSINVKLKANLNYDNGYILLTFEAKKDTIVSGNFLISRSSNLNNYIWEPIRDFTLQSIKAEKWTFMDCTIEQGVLYKYSIQQFNDKQVYSDRIESDVIEVDFEDAFLFDGERQLKIRFNPKVSSFKTDLQESKTDTIGYKYPYFTRNSHIYYREFPISGLISYLSDENELFIDKSELKINYNKWDSSDIVQPNEGIPQKRASEFYEITTDLTANNFISERTFKLTVLDWLNNGKPKLFRSPGEGNYLVRLMNVSLSPTDSLSRMLHTFSCTAYEIAECTLENLAAYQIYDRSLTTSLQRHWATINIADYLDDFYQQLAFAADPTNYTKVKWNILKEEAEQDVQKAQALQTLKNQLKASYKETNGTEWVVVNNGQKLPEVFVVDMVPGSKIKINNEEIVIGTTGSYRVHNELDPFETLAFSIDATTSGLITYTYDAQASDVFGIMEGVTIQDIPLFQTIGKNTIKEIPFYDEDGIRDGYIVSYNLMEILQDSRKSILNLMQVRAVKRPIIDVVINGEQSYQSLITNLAAGRINGLSFNVQEGMDEKTYALDGVYNDINPMNLYQLRAPFTMSRKELAYYTPDWSNNEVPYGEGDILRTYIYKDHQPYTFEQYYIDKNMDTFYPYTGFFYDPSIGKVVLATNDFFTFQIEDEIIDVSDIETWTATKLNRKTQKIIPNYGVSLELSYSQQITTYSFDSLQSEFSNSNIIEARKKYEKNLALYLIYKNQGADNLTLQYIKDYAPSAAAEIIINESQNIFSIPSNLQQSINGEEMTVVINLNETDMARYKQQLKQFERFNYLLYRDYLEQLDLAISKYRKENESS